MSFIPAVLALLISVSMFLLPESPYWLIEFGREEEARKSLSFFRKTPIDEEFEEIMSKRDMRRAENAGNRYSIASRLARSTFLKPFCIVGGLRLMLAWTGQPVLSAYLVTIFDVVNEKTGMDPKLGPIYIGSGRLVAAFLASALIRKLPRKLLFSVSAGAMAACNFGLATYSYVNQEQDTSGGPDKSTQHEEGWVPIILISIFFISSAMGVMPMAMLLCSEMYPTDIRTLSTGITLGSGIGMAAIATKLFPEMLSALDMGNMFIVFGTSCLLLLAWGTYFIPENEGVSLVKTEDNKTNSNN